MKKQKTKIKHGNLVIVALKGSNNVNDTQKIINEVVTSVPEFTYDVEYNWIEVLNLPTQDLGNNQIPIIIRGKLTNQNWYRLKNHPMVIKVYRDTPIQPARKCNCSIQGRYIPTIKEIRKQLGVNKIWEYNVRGKGIVVGIVDSGIQAIGRSQKGIFNNVIGGFPSSDWGTKSDWDNHGNMVAYDVLGIAPDIKLYDIRISDLYGYDRISDVAQAYNWAIRRCSL